MELDQLLFGIFSGDSAVLSLVFVLLLPFALVYSFVKWAHRAIFHPKKYTTREADQHGKNAT